MKRYAFVLAIGLGFSTLTCAGSLAVQDKLVAEADLLASKGQHKKACDLYFKASEMGFVGDYDQMDNPKQHASQVKSHLEYAKCYEKNNPDVYSDPEKLHTFLSYSNIKSGYTDNLYSKEAVEIQKKGYEQVKYILTAEPALIQSKDQKIYQDCMVAETIYSFGWNGGNDADRTLPDAQYYPNSAVIYSMCLVLNPRVGNDPATDKMVSKGILMELIKEYNNPIARMLIGKINGG